MGSSRVREWLNRLAPIYPGEGPVVWLCFAVNFLVVAGIMFGRNARDSLFLIYFGKDYLPYMYFVNAVFLVVCSLGYTSLVDRFDRAKFLGGISVIFLAGLIVSRVILLDRPHWFFPVLYILAQAIWYFGLMQFWTFVGDLFDTRQAKRLFPFLAVGALLGMICVGVTSKTLVHGLGTENLLVVWAILILAATILGGVTYQRYKPAKEAATLHAGTLPPPRKLSEWQKIKDGLRELGRQPLLRSMAGYVLLMWTVYATVDFCFNATMRAKYPDPNELTTFFGRFIGVQGFACLIVQLFLTRPVISRLGVGTTIDFHPTTLFLGTLWMSASYGYGSVLSTKLGDAVMLYTFSDSSYQLLYNPVPLENRPRVRGLIEGYIKPLSLAASGVLVLLGNKYLQPIHLASGRVLTPGQQLSWGALAGAVVWLGFASTAKKGYIRALLRNLQAGSPALRQAAATALSKLRDPTTLSLLSQTLQSENPERVVASVLFLEGLGDEGAKDAIGRLLGHSDPRVRATAASALGRLAPAQFAGQLVPMLRDADERVRANALEALGNSKNLALAEHLRPLLADASRRVRINALLALIALEGAEVARGQLPALKELAQSTPVSRSAAAYALGQIPLAEAEDILCELLKDPELTIRIDAVKALGHVGSRRVIPNLLEALAGPAELRHFLRHSLAAIVTRGGNTSIEDLVKAASSSERVEIRSELAHVLGRFQHPLVIPTLITLLKDPEWRVRWKVLRAFAKMARRGPLPENIRAALFQYAADELRSFRESLRCSQALLSCQRTDGGHALQSPLNVGRPALAIPPSATNGEASRLLARALEEDRAKIEERVFRMLGILCGREQMQSIFDKLHSGDARQKADALEALDNLAPKEIGRQLVAILEPAPAHPAPSGATPSSSAPWLATLTQHSKAWLRACAAYYLGEYSPGDGAALLQPLLADRDPAVRETALYAGWRAFGDAWRPQLEAARAASDPALHRALQRILGSEAAGRSADKSGQGPNGPGTSRSALVLLTVEKVLFLKSAPLFAGLDSEELATLADIALQTEYAADEIIFEEGQPAHHLYILVRGKVEVFRRVDSDAQPLAALGERECFGEMAVLDAEPRSASVRTLEPSVVLMIDRDSFHNLIHERPQISFAIFKILSGRLRHKNFESESSASLDSARHYA